MRGRAMRESKKMNEVAHSVIAAWEIFR
jgi:hypothetical protein